MSGPVVVGLDPDSKRHGVAVYRNGQLEQLLMLSLVELRAWLDANSTERFLFSIEDVLSQNFVYARNSKSSKAAHAKVALSVGRCQQAQEEVMRELDAREVPYHLHKPARGNWANNKDQFERVTGWRSSSNPETRSAAYFGFIASRKFKNNNPVWM
ncbi:hypothetical protein [Pseudohongiella spirulinae]|uniref:Uncharacterized protein n=1 Tax=Pseudohongiella spirulinae TaxID=1249552 RepID=A0A0S2KE37_9GAMM|nr:hypothetical protein [Pseudohongiella spirulinae]ALO46587.1 hypothetical protein PS2015_1943 [Pseudohongiella spirulinae]